MSVTDQSTSRSAPPTKGQRPTEPLVTRLTRWAVAAVIILPVIWAAAGLEGFSLSRLFLRAPGDIWNILKEMVPPDLSGDAVSKALGAVLDSVYIAWVGTLIGAAASFVMAFIAARNMTPRPVSAVARFVLSSVRAFPELLLAIIFIPIVGLGPFAGVLAIGIHSIGTLGKLSGEVIENIDTGPVEAIDASGATGFARVRWAVIPQVLPEIVAYWLYRFEINIRASAVLGIIGAGGIGDRLQSLLRFREFAQVGTVLLMTIIVVMIVDAISSRIRARIIAGPDGSDDPKGNVLRRLLASRGSAGGAGTTGGEL